MSTAAKPKWWEGTITGFDTETSGVNPHDDRIVTASIVHRISGQRPKTIEWIIDPGVDIPAEAAAVHGWTRDTVLQTVGGEGYALRVSEGQSIRMTRDGALGEIAGQLGTAIHVGTPVVVVNAAYDLTLLEAELVRNGIDTLSARPDGVRGIVDPQVIEKQYDPWRKTCYDTKPSWPPPESAGLLQGPQTRYGCDRENRVHHCGGCRKGKYDCGGCGITDRTLSSLCRHYGVVLANAHSSSADALAGLRLAVKLAGLWPEIARWKLPTLHAHQVDWRRDQQKGLADWFRKVGKTEEAAGVCGEWPLHKACVHQNRAVA